MVSMYKYTQVPYIYFQFRTILWREDEYFEIDHSLIYNHHLYTTYTLPLHL